MELVVNVVDTKNNIELEEVAGFYQHLFEDTKLQEIDKGNFIFERKGGHGFIFKSNDGTWSVSIVNYLDKQNCTKLIDL